jgi:hypothetical protein
MEGEGSRAPPHPGTNHVVVMRVAGLAGLAHRSNKLRLVQISQGYDHPQEGMMKTRYSP